MWISGLYLQLMLRTAAHLCRKRGGSRGLSNSTPAHSIWMMVYRKSYPVQRMDDWMQRQKRYLKQ